MPRHVLVDEPTEEGEQESLCAREQTGKVRRVLNAAGGYESLQEKDIHKWPLWSTTHDELAQIGGPGALVYFELLYQLRFVFFIMALLNTPSMFLNLYAPHNMYDSELLTRAYKTWTARTTLGSVYAEEETLDSQGGLFSGHAAGMWVRTVLDACSVAYFGYFAIKWKREGKKLNEQADGATKSMADYTVSVRPRRSWPAVFKRSDDNDGSVNRTSDRLSGIWHFLTCTTFAVVQGEAKAIYQRPQRDNGKKIRGGGQYGRQSRQTSHLACL